MAQHPYDRQTAEMEYIRETEPPRTTGETPKSAPSADTVADFIAKFTAVGNNLISLLSGLLAAFLILYSGYVLYDTFSTQATARNSWDLLLTEIDESESTLAQAIAAVNDDYRCWLTVYDTKIDYPVLQGQDDLYYANHDIYGNTSLTGAIYLAANNSGDFSDTYNLIYGHHMADGIMFGALDSFETLDYFNSHRTGVIITKDRVYDLHFFAVLDTDAYESMVYNVGDRDLEALRAWLQDNAMIYDAQAAEGDKIVALSTCRDATTSGRLVIFATMTERVLLPMEVENYEAEYDAQSHSAADQIKVTLPEGTTVEYSVDGGQTWSQTPPAVENVMRDPQTQEVTALTVMVKAFHPDYGRAAETSFTMKVLPKAVTVTADPAMIRAADKLLLPGVGAFRDAADKLRKSGMDAVVKDEAARGKPLLGVCLGMQMLFDKSYEYGEHEGLGLIHGSVRPIADVIPQDLKIPHIGWNALHFTRQTPLFGRIHDGDCVYFVHSYYADDCADSVVATTEYGGVLTAAVARGNVYGCQFHPEKSGDVGLNILRAFCEDI